MRKIDYYDIELNDGTLFEIPSIGTIGDYTVLFHAIRKHAQEDGDYKNFPEVHLINPIFLDMDCSWVYTFVRLWGDKLGATNWWRLDAIIQLTFLPHSDEIEEAIKRALRSTPYKHDTIAIVDIKDLYNTISFSIEKGESK